MKPNLLVVQPCQHDSDPAIDRFCESLAETHYVYLVRPLSGFREDSPAGVRFLNFSPERLPGFGEVETVIIVDSMELEGRIREEYPTARHWHMDSRGKVPSDQLAVISEEEEFASFQCSVFREERHGGNALEVG